MVSRRWESMVKGIKDYLILFIIAFPLFAFCQAKSGKAIADKKATFYHNKFVNRKTSSGEKFVQTKYTAAHKTIPLNTLVKITNKNNGRSVIVKVNDRCPKRGVIDLSLVAAKRLQMIKDGVASVKIEILSNDYIDIWERQDEIFNMFDRVEEKDSLRSAYFDSILLDKSDKLKRSFSITKYVRLTKVDSRSKAKIIIDQLPDEYQSMAKVIISENKRYYYVNIGPFITLNTTKDVVTELKEKFPQIQILENKNTE